MGLDSNSASSISAGLEKKNNSLIMVLVLNSSKYRNLRCSDGCQGGVAFTFFSVIFLSLYFKRGVGTLLDAHFAISAV